MKKLERNPENAVIAGVCSGIGEYFNIPANLVRTIFAAATFFMFWAGADPFSGMIGIVAYIILARVIPKKKPEAKGPPPPFPPQEQGRPVQPPQSGAHQSQPRTSSGYNPFRRPSAPSQERGRPTQPPPAAPDRGRPFDTTAAKDAEIKSRTERGNYGKGRHYSEEEFYKESRNHSDDF